MLPSNNYSDSHVMWEIHSGFLSDRAHEDKVIMGGTFIPGLLTHSNHIFPFKQQTNTCCLLIDCYVTSGLTFALSMFSLCPIGIMGVLGEKRLWLGG